MTFAFSAHVSEFPSGQGKDLREEDRLHCLWESGLAWGSSCVNRKGWVSRLGVPSLSESRDSLAPSPPLCISLIAKQSKPGLLPRLLSFPCLLPLRGCLWVVIESFSKWGPASSVEAELQGGATYPAPVRPLHGGQRSRGRVAGTLPGPQVQPGCTWAFQPPGWSQVTLWHTALSLPEFSIPKALMGSCLHFVQFRNYTFNPCHSWALGKQESFLRSHSSVGKTDKDIDMFSLPTGVHSSTLLGQDRVLGN